MRKQLIDPSGTRAILSAPATPSPSMASAASAAVSTAFLSDAGLTITENTKDRYGNLRKGFFSGKAKGTWGTTFSVDATIDSSTVDPATGDFYIYLQFVRYGEFIGYSCSNGSPDCEIFREYEFVEWTFDELPPSYINPNPPESWPANLGTDNFELQPEGTGCFKVLIAESYLIMSGHPRYNDIKKRLQDEYEKQKKGPKGNAWTDPFGETSSVGGFSAGASDADGNGHEDVTETSSVDSTRDMIKDDPSGDHWASLPTPPPTQLIPNPSPISQSLTLDWDTCGGSDFTPTPGVGL